MTILYKGNPILTDSDERKELEEKLWDDYQENHQHDFAVIVNYYRLYLTEFIRKKLRKKYDSAETKEEVTTYNLAHLPDAFTYSMGKGHSEAIEWLAHVPSEFKLEDFAKPNFGRTMILAYQQSLANEEVIKKNLQNDINNRYANYLDKLTENMFITFQETAQVLFFKGFLLAIDQLKEHYKIQDTGVMYSPLSNLPVNRTVQITPAMEGEWIIGDENIEVWGVHWDQSYSEYDYENDLNHVYTDDNLIINVWTTTLKDIVLNSQAKIGTFMMLNKEIQGKKNLKFAANKDDTQILVLEYTFTQASLNPEKSPHEMKSKELEGLEQAIIDRFSNSMDIPYNNTFVIYSSDPENNNREDN